MDRELLIERIDEKLETIIDKLNEARTALTTIELPDEMTVVDWNRSPVGRAVRRIDDIIDMIDPERQD